VGFPWFAPAGTRRGIVDNATSVGYIDSATGEFQQISLTESIRDSMHSVKVNPITFFSGTGILNFGNLTKTSTNSALDRINVSRLTVYLRSQLDKIAKPFIFEPNDSLTRNEIKGAIESFLLELVGQRALYDFLVVCDETNNTATRIDRNELYVDIAIEPVKSVEFIYIPLRIKNTGEIANLGV
jgi:phage tail sheath protein FI